MEVASNRRPIRRSVTCPTSRRDTYANMR
jgi:hypothetical protein